MQDQKSNTVNFRPTPEHNRINMGDRARSSFRGNRPVSFAIAESIAASRIAQALQFANPRIRRTFRAARLGELLAVLLLVSCACTHQARYPSWEPTSALVPAVRDRATASTSRGVRCAGSRCKAPNLEVEWRLLRRARNIESNRTQRLGCAVGHAGHCPALSVERAEWDKYRVPRFIGNDVTPPLTRVRVAIRSQELDTEGRCVSDGPTNCEARRVRRNGHGG